MPPLSHPCARLTATILLLGAIATAEEGGSGHYLPGSMASFVDGVPTGETQLVRVNYLNYRGDIAFNRPIPIAGLATLGAEADSTALGLTALWRPPVDLGPKWSWAVSATLPYVWMDVEADVITGPGTVRRSDSISGIGDLVLMPLMFNYQACEDLNINFRLGAYAPTGRYQTGRLANTGKNYWTIEPTVAWMYFGQKNGREASLFLGADYNWENPDTNYKTGTQIHADGTLAQHIPLWGGLIGLGINGYWYEQVAGDSGAGAIFGDFKGRSAGLGPVVSYASKLHGHDVIAEFKWLHEFETRNRLEGDYLWLKAIYKF